MGRRAVGAASERGVGQRGLHLGVAVQAVPNGGLGATKLCIKLAKVARVDLVRLVGRSPSSCCS